MKLVNFLILLLLWSNTYAQQGKSVNAYPFNFKADPIKSKTISFKGNTNKAEKNAYDRALDLEFLKDKNYELEFRLYKYHMDTNYDDAFVLRLKNNKWTARYFDRRNGNRTGISFIERKIDQTKVDQLWQLLVQNNILTLPSQADLQDKLVQYKVDTTSLEYPTVVRMDMSDGAGYHFQLTSGKKKRVYSYHCPQTFLSRYSNVKELYHAVIVVMLIQKFLGQALSVC